MRRTRELIVWLVLGSLGLAVFLWAVPRAFPFLPQRFSVTRDEAVAIALERLRDLGDPVADPFVVAMLQPDPLLERRLDLALAEKGKRSLEETGLTQQVSAWRVLIYSPGTPAPEWTYQVLIAPDGEVLALRLRLDPAAPGKAVAPRQARDRADAFLAEEGIDLSRYGEPEVRSEQLAKRTDLRLRYPAKAPAPTPDMRYGVEVVFAGDRLAGFQPWRDDPNQRELQGEIQALNFQDAGTLIMLYVLIGVLTVPFLKRYHEGVIGPRRGGKLFLVVLGAAALLLLLVAVPNSQQIGFGFATRVQLVWVLAVFSFVFQFMPLALSAFLGWSVGESVCREQWGQKLAAFDALFSGRFANATVARSALRGWLAGLLLAGGFAALMLGFESFGIWPLASFLVSASSQWPGLQLALTYLVGFFPILLAIVLYLLPATARRLGRWGGAAVCVVAGALVLTPPVFLVPLSWGLLASGLFVAGLVVVFLVSDLLTVLLAGGVSQLLFFAYPLLTAEDATLQANGWLALGLLAVPLAVSLRHLGSDKEFVYSYEDIPPHVRRIAERERQRVELETARRIQSSILPELPPRLSGVDLAHAYLPASEVGGDFYDVLALEDGRLAVAVGDVAGHGVSSGLIMSMAKSALAVQVTFDPEVAAVFNTLNRTVYQTARKRLLATLCYALIDPRRLEMVYASAGHLFPYRIDAAGRVEALESVAYPLGVRGKLEIEARTAKLAPGDTLFLFSDGVVEACVEGKDEPYGFERLEASLARHGQGSVESLRDGVLADVARYTANAPREDDQTILVLRLP